MTKISNLEQKYDVQLSCFTTILGIENPLIIESHAPELENFDKKFLQLVENDDKLTLCSSFDEKERVTELLFSDKDQIINLANLSFNNIEICYKLTNVSNAKLIFKLYKLKRYDLSPELILEDPLEIVQIFSGITKVVNFDNLKKFDILKIEIKSKENDDIKFEIIGIRGI